MTDAISSRCLWCDQDYSTAVFFQNICIFNEHSSTLKAHVVVVRSGFLQMSVELLSQENMVADVARIRRHTQGVVVLHIDAVDDLAEIHVFPFRK